MPKCIRECAMRNVSAHCIGGESTHTSISNNFVSIPHGKREREKERNGQKDGQGEREKSRGGRIILRLRRRGGERESRGDEKLEAGRGGGRKRGERNIGGIPREDKRIGSTANLRDNKAITGDCRGYRDLAVHAACLRRTFLAR